MIVAHIGANLGFPLRPTVGGEHEERAEDLDSSQRVHDHLVAYHLAPAITDFILDENRECCNTDLNRNKCCCIVNGVKTSSPRGKNQQVIHSPIGKKGTEFMLRNVRWQAPLMATAAYDP